MMLSNAPLDSVVLFISVTKALGFTFLSKETIFWSPAINGYKFSKTYDWPGAITKSTGAMLDASSWSKSQWGS